MSENTRTTVNVSKESHKDASDVKDEFDESWSEVLEFYANHRGELSVGSDGGTVDKEYWATFDEKLQYHLSEWETTVNLDQLDLAPLVSESIGGGDNLNGELADIQTELDSINSKLRRITE